MRRALLNITALIAVSLGGAGCVKRTISISSEPSGALVWVNDREIGRTPIEIGFLHYGTYDVRLVKDGFEPLLTTGDAKAPLWDVVGFDLISEILPAELESRVAWHYDLVPQETDHDVLRAGLVERGRELRDRLAEGADAEGEGASAARSGSENGQ